MTHLSPLSYIDRLVNNVLVFLFLVIYCYVIGTGVQDLQCDRLKKMVFKSVVSLILLLAVIFAIASDSVSISFKYRQGYYDSCVVSCGQPEAGETSYNCTHLVSSQCPEGVVPKPTSEYDSSYDAEVLVPVANTLFNVGCMLRSNALFLLIAGYHYSLRNIFPNPTLSHREFYIYLFYTVIALPLYFVLQFAVSNDIGLGTVLPQFLFLLEIAVQVVLLIYLNLVVSLLLQSLPRNYESPRASEATLLYMRWMTWVLVLFLIMNLVGLLVINLTFVMSIGEDNNPYTGFAESLLKLDVFTKIFNAGYMMTPVVATLINYRPSTIMNAQLGHYNSATATNYQNAASTSPRAGNVGMEATNKTCECCSKEPKPVAVQTDSCENCTISMTKELSKQQKETLPSKMYVNTTLGSLQGGYLLNALLQTERKSQDNKDEQRRSSAAFRPISQAIAEEDAEYDRKLRSESSIDNIRRSVSSTLSTLSHRHANGDEASSDEEEEEEEEVAISYRLNSGSTDTYSMHRSSSCSKTSVEDSKQDQSCIVWAGNNQLSTCNKEGESLDHESSENFAEYVLTSEMDPRSPPTLVDESPTPTQSKRVSFNPATLPPLLVRNHNAVAKSDEEEDENISYSTEGRGAIGQKGNSSLDTAPKKLPRARLALQTTFSQIELPRFGASNMVNVLNGTVSNTSDSVDSTSDRFWQQSKATNPRYIPTGKEMHSGGVKFSIRKKKKKSRSGEHYLATLGELTLERRMELAELWLSDALENREPKLHRVRGLPLKVYRFKHSKMWRAFLYVLIAIQMVLLPFLEPVSTLRLTETYLAKFPNYSIAIGLDLFFVLVFLFDALMGLYTYGSRELQLFRCSWVSLRKKRSSRSLFFHFRLFVTIVALVNIIVALASRTAYRFDRYFRWFSVIFVSKSVRNVFGDLVVTFRDFLGVIATYCFAITIYGLLGIVIFDPVQYDEYRDGFWGNATSTPEQMYRVDTFPWLSLNLYVLTTLEAFPDLLWPAYNYLPFVSFVYWISFVIVTILFLQSIAVPLVYEPLQKRQRERLMQGKIAERKALVAAFEILDIDDNFYLTEEVVNQLLRSFSSKNDARIIMRLLDEDENGKIDLLEFFQIVDSIKLKIKVKAEEVISPYVTLCGCTIARRPFQKIKQSRFFSLYGSWLTIILLVFLMLYRMIDLSIIVSVMGLYILYILVETVILFLSGPIRSTLKSGKRFAARVVLLVTEILLLILYVSTNMNGFLSALRVVMIINIYRVLYLIPTLWAIVFVCSKLKRILATVLMIVLTIMYGYTLFGMDIFSDNTYTNHPSGVDPDFKDFPHAFITVFQLVTGANWNAVLYVCSVSVDHSWGWWFLSVGYFLSFNLIVDLYILSIVLAIFLDAFLVFRNVKEDTVSEYIDNTKVAKVLGIPSKKYLLFKKRSLEETLYEDFLIQNHKNTIQELLDLGIIRNVGAIREYTRFDDDSQRPVFHLHRYGSSMRQPSSPRGEASSHGFITGKSSQLDSPRTPGPLAPFSSSKKKKSVTGSGKVGSSRGIDGAGEGSVNLPTNGFTSSSQLDTQRSERRIQKGRRATLGAGNQLTFQVSIADAIRNRKERDDKSGPNEGAIDNL